MADDQDQEIWTITDPRDGSSIEIKAPKGTPAPTQAQIEQIFAAQGVPRPQMNAATVNGQPVPVPADDEPNTIGNYLSHAMQGVNIPGQLGQLLPLPQSVGGSGMNHPLAPGGADEQYAPKFLRDMRDVKVQGQQKIAKGDYVGGGLNWAESYIPLLGPAMANMGNQLQKGQYAAAAGDATGMAAGAALPLALESGKVGPLLKNPNPQEAAAMEYARQKNIPRTAGAATGNRFLQGFGALMDRSPIGSIVERRARQVQRVALEKEAGALADASRSGNVAQGGGPVDYVEAGTDLKAQNVKKIQAHQQFAEHYYDDVQQAQNNPANDQLVKVDGKWERMQLPVDLRSVKATLRPLYEKLKRQYPLTRQQASGGFKALENIVNGPDYAPIMQTEDDLGAIKEIARGSDPDVLPELRQVSEALAGKGVSVLQDAVDATAAKVDPKLLDSLKRGRAATFEKFNTAELVNLDKEPAGLVQELVLRGDRNIDKLKAIAKAQPASLPSIARAHLEHLFTLKADKLFADWEALGPRTKQVLYTPKQIAAIDNYALLVKRLGENPNSSGTAYVGSLGAWGTAAVASPLKTAIAAIGAGGLAAILRNETAIDALTKGIQLTQGPVKSSALAQAAAASALLNAARLAGVPVQKTDAKEP